MSTLRLMTYNVRYFGHATRGIASTAWSLQRIAHALAHLEPLADVVCLQEVETSSLRSTWLHPRRPAGETQLDRLLDALANHLRKRAGGERYDGYYFPAHDYRIGERTSFYTTGLAILVRRPLHLRRHNAASPFDITHRGGRPHAHPTASSDKPWLKQTRICAHVALEHPVAGPFDLFNTHLSLPSFLTASFWRPGADRMGHGPNQLEEARALRAFVDRERSDDRFVVVGDLNALPGSPVYELLTREAGWHDPVASALGGVGPMRGFPTAGFLHLRMHIDHVLSGAGVAWGDLDGTHDVDDPRGAFVGLSDHAPLIGRFTLRPM